MTRQVARLSLLRWLQRHARLKAAARASVAALLRTLPAPVAYRARRAVEKLVYSAVPEVGELPPIFHYWSNTYLRPKLEAAGYASPDDFFFREVFRRAAERAETSVRCMSIACGRCEMEIAMAVRLRDAGVRNVHISACDINADMLRDAEAAAMSTGVREFFTFATTDLNTTAPSPESADVLIANQCLHHFTDLESVLDFVQATLTRDGLFLTSDVIGRNGHMLWPEALDHVERIWEQLPARYRADRALGTTSNRYVNYNHANVGFEGIRAQDILGLLVERFDFEFCLPFGCIILPFVERRFGWNFDPLLPEDRATIDRIALMDEDLIERGVLKPTQLLAAMRQRGRATPATAEPNRAARRAWRNPAADGVGASC